MNDRRAGKAGFSLIEALIAMVVMTFILGAVGVLYFTSYHVWQRTSAESQAEPPANIAISRISKELKNAKDITEVEGISNSITFTLPATEDMTIVDADNISRTISVNSLPLTAARQITYYISDDTGAIGEGGTILWRSEQNLLTGASNLKRIADNMEELEFEFAAADEGTRMLKVYAMSVTVQGKEGRHVHRSEFKSHVAFRNAG